MEYIYYLFFFLVPFSLQYFFTVKSANRITRVICPLLIICGIIFAAVLYFGGTITGSDSNSVIAENRYFAKTVASLLISSLVGCVSSYFLASQKKKSK